jgi:hypothetical protein
MRLRSVIPVVLPVIALSFALSVSAQEGKPEMSPEQKAMMEKWKAYMTPGEPHAEFAKAVGTWDYKTKMWEQPGAPPQEAEGTATFKTILGGRYLVQSFEGPFMGQAFHGKGITGYDNMIKKYQAMWIDNMGTGIMISEGTCEGDVCTYYGDAPDVMLGKYKRVKSVSRNLSDDEMVFEMYDTGPDGKEWRTFEIIYHRRK